MDEEAEKARKTIRQDITRIALSVIPMFMLLWILYTGFQFVAKPNRDAKYNCFVFSVGVVIILLGFVFVLIGLAVVADLALNLTVRLQQEEEEEEKKIGIQQDSKNVSRMEKGTGRGTKSIHKEIGRILATVMSMLMVLWAIYTGFRLATEQKSDGNYHHLGFSVGVVSIAFGLIYFIIGIAIVADLARNFLRHLKQQQKKQFGCYLCRSTDYNY